MYGVWPYGAGELMHPFHSPSLTLPACLLSPPLGVSSQGLEWVRPSPCHLILKLNRIILISRPGPVRSCESPKGPWQFGGRAGDPKARTISAICCLSWQPGDLLPAQLREGPLQVHPPCVWTRWRVAVAMHSLLA